MDLKGSRSEDPRNEGSESRPAGVEIRRGLSEELEMSEGRVKIVKEGTIPVSRMKGHG